ncbi:hypothetical protein QA639_33280 [Bradyrhizobium pachyrhizi]|nr:hypothetical protein [Bradyrhizobium pachyrhizi]WFU54474.1 hypothetical protein QA639_33280 [Bradyrhizobium pachyrhizi]
MAAKGPHLAKLVDLIEEEEMISPLPMCPRHVFLMLDLFADFNDRIADLAPKEIARPA